MADERLRGDERYLDEVKPSPPRWRTALGWFWCVVLPAAIVVGAKLFLFEEMSTVDFAIRSVICGVLVLVLWAVFFRRRLAEH
jgi:hypothetical protein